MPGSSRRRAKLVPWYHVPKPQCITFTQANTQCRSSASYMQVGRSDTVVCKTHRDILVLQRGFRFEPIRERFIDISVERPDDHTIIPIFRSAGG